MRKSRNITLTVLAGIMLTACCCMGQPRGWWRRPAPDYTWYDAQGTAIPVKWKLDASGNKLLENGRPIPDPHVPYDRYHRPWVYNETTNEWEPPPPPAGSSSSSSHSSWRPGGLFFFGSGGGGSGYRSSGSSSSSSRTSSPSSVSRGGFGTTSSSSSS